MRDFKRFKDANGAEIVINVENITHIKAMSDKHSRIYFDSEHHVTVEGGITEIGDLLGAQY